jgi:hypothetical protein
LNDETVVSRRTMVHAVTTLSKIASAMLFLTKIGVDMILAEFRRLVSFSCFRVVDLTPVFTASGYHSCTLARIRNPISPTLFLYSRSHSSPSRSRLVRLVLFPAGPHTYTHSLSLSSSSSCPPPSPFLNLRRPSRIPRRSCRRPPAEVSEHE